MSLIRLKKNYIPNLIWAIHKSTSKNINKIKLVLGIPVENMGAINKYKDELEGKEFKFKVNNDDYRTVLIERVAVVAEGVSSFYTLSEKKD